MVKAIFSPSALAVTGLLMMSGLALNASEHSEQESNTTKEISESVQTQNISDKAEEKKD